MSEKHYTLQQLGWKTFFNQQLTLEKLETYQPFRVIQVHRNRLLVLGEKDKLNLDLGQFQHLTQCTVGDWLLLTKDGQEMPLILDRLSLFKRKAPGAHQQQNIAANVDTALS